MGGQGGALGLGGVCFAIKYAIDGASEKVGACAEQVAETRSQRRTRPSRPQQDTDDERGAAPMPMSSTRASATRNPSGSIRLNNTTTKTVNIA